VLFRVLSSRILMPTRKHPFSLVHRCIAAQEREADASGLVYATLRTSIAMDEIIEIMSRAEIDFFRQASVRRFDEFEKAIADGVRARMRAIVAALEAEGLTICPVERDGWSFR
jgi:hypothetical protein